MSPDSLSRIRFETIVCWDTDYQDSWFEVSYRLDPGLEWTDLNHYEALERLRKDIVDLVC